MPPQGTNAVIDDEYGLEKAQPATTPSKDEDDYGLEVAATAKPKSNLTPQQQQRANELAPAKERVSQKTEFEKERTPGPDSGYWSGFKAALPSLKDIAIRASLGGLNPISDYETAKDLAANTGKRFERGSGEHGVIGGIAESAAPLAGISPESMRERAEHGDTSGILGEATIPTIQAMAPVAHEAGVKTIKSAPLPKLPGPTEFPGAVLDKVVRGTPITEEGKLAAAKEQALTVKKPSMSETEYAQKVSDAMPELQKIAQDNKGKIKTPRQAVQAINNRISEIEAPITEHIKDQNAPHQMLQPEDVHDAINTAMDRELAKKPGSYKPSEIEKAKKTVSEFIGDQPKSLAEVEGNRRRLNQDADAYYNTDTAGKRAIDVSDATAVAQRAAANAIRDILYGDEKTPGALEKAGVTAVDANGRQVPLRDVRKQVGKLLDVRDHFEDAITKAEATGDWKPFGSLFTGPSIAAGGLGAITGTAVGGPIGAIFGTLAGEGLKSWGDYLRSKNPNLNVQKMFRNLAETSAPNVPQIKTMTPPVPRSAMPAAVQQTLGLPRPEHGPLFQIEQTPRLRPDVEEPRLAPIQGEQVPLNLPPENAPLFNIQQTPAPAPQRIGGWNPLDVKNAGSVISKPSEIPSPIFRGTAANIEPAEAATAKLTQPTALKSGETTADRFYDKENDQWAPEREANHEAIAKAATAGKIPPKGRPPEATITVGGTGAGKTTVTRGILADDPNLVNVDSDANKLQIPEYEGLKKTDPQKAAARVHDESKAISKRIIQEAVSKGLDFVYDTSTGGGGTPLFKKLKDLGYKVKVIYADVPVEEAINRANNRALNSTDPSNRGRVVPEDIIRKKHEDAARAFEEHRKSPYVDEVRAFDTTTRTPEEFYNRSAAGEKVANQKTLDRVREKAGIHAGK